MPRLPNPKLANLAKRFAKWKAPSGLTISLTGRICLLRVRRGLSLEELADRTCLSVRVLQAIEDGRDPRFNEMLAICRALELDAGELVAGLDGTDPAIRYHWQEKDRTKRREKWGDRAEMEFAG